MPTCSCTLLLTKEKWTEGAPSVHFSFVWVEGAATCRRYNTTLKWQMDGNKMMHICQIVMPLA